MIKKCFERLYNCIIKENPTLVLMLGMCPTLAVTTGAVNAICMCLSTTAVLMVSNLMISALRKVIPDKVRIPCYIVLIAGFVTMVQMLVKAFAPALAAALGMYLPLLVVNCIILGRAEAFASRNSVMASAVDGLTQGIGYTAALVVMCIVRELLGSGTFGKGVFGADGIRLIDAQYPALMVILPVGGFLTLGCLIAGSQWLNARMKEKEEKK